METRKGLISISDHKLDSRLASFLSLRQLNAGPGLEVLGVPVEYWGGPPLGVQILYTFPTPKMGMKQIEQFSDIILHFLRFLAESSGVAKLELFQPFPHVNGVSAGVPTPPDSGKTPQLKTSKLAQNCGKIEVLHLQPSYGICWSHEIETLPPM